MKHLDGLGLITPAGREKAVKLLVGLLLVRGRPSPIQALSPRLCRNNGCQVGNLLGLQRDQLVAGLGCLELADGGSA
jgi:hypothetical protein